MNQLIYAALFLALALIALTYANQESLDKDVNNLFCQLNEFAAMRLNNRETLFPCKDDTDK